LKLTSKPTKSGDFTCDKVRGEVYVGELASSRELLPVTKVAIIAN